MESPRLSWGAFNAGTQKMMRSMQEANKTPSHLVRRVIVKRRRIHKLLTGRKKLAIQQHLIIPSRENPTHLRRERSSTRLRGAVPPEDAESQYQLPLDETFPGKTTTEHARKTDNRRSRADHDRHARPASKLSTKGQTFPTPKGLAS
jgi:hypothetical protein